MTSAPEFVLTATELDALRNGAHEAPMPSGVFRVEGSGALQCVQGVYTNDVLRHGPDALMWGAVLTAKGMIVFDMWVLRDGDAAWMIVPAVAHATAAAAFNRTFPPRIAKVTDRTTEVAVSWILGRNPHAGPGLIVPASPAPFAALRFGESGANPVGETFPKAPAGWASAARVLAGWPALGREIDDRTLLQEVRFDSLDGVRHNKGCYTGQETVARLHFRGHPNRMLRGLQWRDAAPTGSDILNGDKNVGTISTWGLLDGRPVGMAKLRREVDIGADVDAGGGTATVVDLPFDDQ
ncbi:MAG: hypothetical protein ABIR59_04990 [Gemmatimonadales bacterium]